MTDTITKPAVVAVKAELSAQGLTTDQGSAASQSQAAAVAAVAVAAAPATQVRRPWRSTLRTIFQLTVALAAMLPVIVDASGADETLPAVGGALFIAGGVTRVMALPAVEQFLQRFVPWLAASPRPSA